MNYIKKFLGDESGTAEAASSAVMIGMTSGLLSGGISGIWDSLIDNPAVLILVLVTVVLIGWAVFKA